MDGLEVLLRKVRRDQLELERLFDIHEDLDKPQGVDPQLVKRPVRRDLGPVPVRDRRDPVDQLRFYLQHSQDVLSLKKME